MKRLICALCALWIGMGLLACGQEETIGSGKQEQRPVPTVLATPTPAPTPAPTPTPLHMLGIEHTWQPQLWDGKYDAAVKTAFFGMVEAVMGMQPTFACKDADQMFMLASIAQSLFPPFSKLVSRLDFEEGAAQVTYALKEEAHKELLRKFGLRVENLIEPCLMQSDGKAQRAVALYLRYVGLIAYDEKAANSLSMEDVNCYRGLTELKGIDLTFAQGYAYLLLQSGVRAETVQVELEDGGVRECVRFWLGSEAYLADPMGELLLGGKGLACFGSGEDDRFADLRGAQQVKLQRSEAGMTAKCTFADGTVQEVPIR